LPDESRQTLPSLNVVGGAWTHTLPAAQPPSGPAMYERDAGGWHTRPVSSQPIELVALHGGTCLVTDGLQLPPTKTPPSMICPELIPFWALSMTTQPPSVGTGPAYVVPVHPKEVQIWTLGFVHVPPSSGPHAQEQLAGAADGTLNPSRMSVV
jgi:hypothetical protein